MAIFVTGDVHGGAEYGSSRFSSKSWPDGRTLSRDDVVVVAGDFGFVWDGSNTDRYWLDWFESKPWTTCFVDGNHENHRMLAELPETEWNGGRVHVARPHVLHLMRGEVFDIAGTTVLAMGGAASHDREWRKEGKSWWPEEMPSETEMERARRVHRRARRRDFGVRYAAARHGWGEQAPSRVGEGKAPAGVAALARCPESALKEHGRRTLLRPCFGALKRLSDVHLCQIS